jgi:hypothetical protein
MMKNYMTTGTFTRGKKPEGSSVGKVVTPFPEEKVVMLIYGGSAPYESRRKLKLTSRAVKTVSPATLEYLHWSESPITFDQTDHPDSIPKPRRFPYIVDLLVGTTRLTKALVDGGSGINLMYLDTFEGLGLTWNQLQSNPHSFHGVVPRKQFIRLRRVTLSVIFGDASNYYTEMLMFEVFDFSGPYHIILRWSCYDKFMDIPSYAYLKLKKPRPAEVITVEAKPQ